MFRQPRVIHLFHNALRFQPVRHFYRILLGSLHADAKGLDPPQKQPAVKGRQPRSRGLDQEPQLLLYLLVVCHKESGQRIIVSAQKLCATVDHNICAQL